MGTDNYEELIKESANKGWFESFVIEIDFSIEEKKSRFEGMQSLYEFVKKQAKGWNKKLKEVVFFSELDASQKYFNEALKILNSFITKHGEEFYRDEELDREFNNVKRYINNESSNRTRKVYVLFFDSPRTNFLIPILKEDKDVFSAAYSYFKGNNFNNIRNKKELKGYLSAFQFESEIKDQKSIISTKNNLEELIEDFESFKIGKEKLFEDWFINTKGHYEEFSNRCDTRIEELEKTYKEKLKLEEPAKYWANRAGKLRTRAWKSLWVLVGLILIIVTSLGFILWNPPAEIFNSFFDGDKSAAIRWSIIYITFISFMAYCIRAVNKVMFSSFHLARDCEERHALTYFYLALFESSDVTDNERELIMQSLFSRAETGLLKDDSSPAMPNDIAGKIFNKT